MGRKYTTEIVRVMLAEEGYTLDSEYSIVNGPIDIICPKGHRYTSKLNNWMSKGARCGRCAHDNKPKKYTTEDVRLSLSNAGYVLNDTYKGCKAKMDVTCDKGHDIKVTYDAWLSKGVRCDICMDKRNGERQRLSHDFVAEQFKKVGYILISPYTTAKATLQVQCNFGHIYETSYDKFCHGIKCRHCSRKTLITQESAEKLFAQHGYTLVDTYTRNNKKMNVICPSGHRVKIDYSHFERGHRCKACKRDHFYDLALNSFTEHGYTLLSKNYKTALTPLDFVCPHGHRGSITWATWRIGHRCRDCAVSGFKNDMPGTLYYLRFETPIGYLYKIGITNRTVKRRFKSEPIPYKVIYTETFLLGYLARNRESEILKKYKKHLYQGEPLLISGNFELFTKDVLKLDVV